ncbi:hypothetical protein HMPREF9248_0555 [Fannyhessea vaginae PB189-T1-4]|uniref:Uncharacterized protein n=1 Tax=Fannyhessea vaginae PB189-T1-4 TaxID=866774 RepID=A0ABP2IZ06_9ACTN|nr:hypothetical protein HMPREF9248_0555 [Fannyhessea vaginae PB189-T1-4]
MRAQPQAQCCVARFHARRVLYSSFELCSSLCAAVQRKLLAATGNLLIAIGDAPTR